MHDCLKCVLLTVHLLGACGCGENDAVERASAPTTAFDAIESPDGVRHAIVRGPGASGWVEVDRASLNVLNRALQDQRREVIPDGALPGTAIINDLVQQMDLNFSDT